jgi:hypothetical protein
VTIFNYVFSLLSTPWPKSLSDLGVEVGREERLLEVVMRLMHRLLGLSKVSRRVLVRQLGGAVHRLHVRNGLLMMMMMLLRLRLVVALLPLLVVDLLDGAQLLLQLHPPVLEPDLDLALGEAERVRDLDAPASR